MPLSRRQLLIRGSWSGLGALATLAGARLGAQSSTPTAAPTPAPAAPPAPEAVFRELRGGVGTFSMSGGTVGWYVGPHAALAVDSQMPDSAPACLAGLEARSARGVDLLINTHHHWDHTGGNAVFRPAVGSIVAHANVPELQRQAAVARDLGEQTVADTTFSESWRRDLGGEAVAARHYGPAHTGGDIVVHFERADVAHMGDLVFNRLFPVIDRPGGARIAHWIPVLERVADEHGADTLYVFGHVKPGLGVTGGRAELLYQRDYLTALLETARRGLAAGRSVDEIAALEAMPGFPDHVSRGTMLSLAANLRAACAELTEG